MSTFVAQPMADAFRLAFNNGIAFDTRNGEPALAANLHVSDYGPGPGYFLVQFSGPVTDDRRAALEGAGARILEYQPNYAFLVRADQAAIGRVRALSGVRWTGVFQPAYKLSGELLHAPAGAGTIDARLLVFHDEDVAGARAALEGAGAHVLDIQKSEWNTVARAQFDRGALERIASLRQVQWIEVYRQPVIDNNVAQWITQTHVSNNRAVWDHGIQGEGQVVSTSDTGVRTSHNQFRDPAVTISASGDYPTHRKVIAYHVMPGANFGDENSSTSTYHGTHTANTICGDDSYVGAADLRDGMALKSKFYFLDIGSDAAGDLTGLPLDLNTMYVFPWTGNAGGQARVCSNSWGAAVNGAYDVYALQADQFMWNHKDFLLVYSAGNSGSATGTIGSPGTAKNIVTVGGTDDTNGNTIGSYSSRGPTLDGRVKPEVVAPGTLSSASGGNDTSYHTLTGTSMASPCAAGNAALLRQYLAEGWYPSGTKIAGDAIPNPSAAIVKALMINSADPGATFPGTDFGWGRIDDDSVLYFSGDTRDLALVDQTSGLGTGDQIEYKVSVIGNTIPLKVTVVWTDYPGAAAAAKELVNDLNLTLVSPTSVTYLGNVFSGGQSVTGGVADNTNVVEFGRRNAPEIGTWTIRVNAANVPVGPQPFALVVTGDLGRTLGLLTLDKPAYAPGQSIGIRLEDADPGLNAPQVTLTSGATGDAESVTLTNQGGGLFTGSLPLLFGVIQSGDGQLSVANGDIVTATYQDANASPATVTASALIDATAFTLSAVRATGITQLTSTINWMSSDNSSSQVYYGTTPALGSSTTLSNDLVLSHSVTLTGLSANTLYYYDVESQDARRNLVRADNGGAHFTFTTADRPDVYVVAGDQTYDLIDHDVLAFARHGWTMDYTFCDLSGDPPLGSKTSGLRSYPVVWWYTGIEQYPQVSDSQLTLWQKLHDSGARLAFSSHDVAWDFIAPTSQGSHATAQRTAWVRNYLHEDFVNDPADIGFVGGIPGDPISGAYPGGVSYTEARTGGAADEINFWPTAGGTAALNWRDDFTSPDSVGLRWTGSTPLGSADSAAWGGTPSKVVVMNYEPMRLNFDTADDVTRGDIVNNTLVWLTGRDHPTATVTAPAGGSTVTSSPISVNWTAAAFGGNTIAMTTIQYSRDLGQTWTTIASGALSPPYSWDVTGVLNANHIRLRVLVADSGSPALHGSGVGGDFTLARPTGDFAGPIAVPGSASTSPNPVTQPASFTFMAAVTDSTTGGSNIHAAEYSIGASPAPAGTGTALSGAFDASQNTSVSGSVATGTLSCTSCTLWLRAQDAALNWGPASSTPFVLRTGVTAVGDGATARFALGQNVPNPFRPATTIEFSLAAAGPAALRVYNTNGALVRTVFAASLAPGSHLARWDGFDDAGRRVAPGIYYYRLETPGRIASRKMVKMN